MSYIDKLLSNDEKILVQERQHPIALAGAFIRLVLQGLVLYIAIQILNFHIPSFVPEVWVNKLYVWRQTIIPLLDRLPEWVLPAIGGLYVLKMVLNFIFSILRWFTSQYIVTSRRAMHVRGVFSKTAVDSSLEKINDVLLVQSIFGRMLGYGHITVMTASEVGLNTMHFLKSPIVFKQTMMDAKRSLSGVGEDLVKPKGSSNILEKMKQLEQLHKEGLIKQDEYEAKRKSLLSQM